MRFFFLIILFISSCNQMDFKQGQCLQKPDSPRVWKVTKVSKSQSELVSIDSKEDLLTINGKGNWSEVNCPN